MDECTFEICFLFSNTLFKVGKLSEQDAQFLFYVKLNTD